MNAPIRIAVRPWRKLGFTFVLRFETSGSVEENEETMKPVICTFCNSEIYTYVGPEPVELKAAHFKPTRPGWAAPKPGDPMYCPVCGSRFVGVSVQNKQLRMVVSSEYAGSGNVGKL
ncbi:hypothetical protein [Chloracidobacterium aggregatum]|jgi:hypothetical protein|nr:hypothetical protein [Chloracidobacterium aggregatum]QUV83905.1 hypothetical protein J8C03_07015 [Chloracidobacterium sp. 2]